MALKSYDPKQVAVIIGTRPISGFADGEFVSVERNNDAWTYTTGADGEGTRVKSNDRSGRVTLTLAQTAVDNAYISELAIADELAGGGTIPVTIRDKSGNDIHATETAWVVKMPVANYDKATTNREWIFETNDLNMYVGGN
jgi:hypothetical protein